MRSSHHTIVEICEEEKQAKICCTNNDSQTPLVEQVCSTRGGEEGSPSAVCSLIPRRFFPTLLNTANNDSQKNIAWTNAIALS